jgi:secondary thiamine-phosphate synthase enzyme
MPQGQLKIATTSRMEFVNITGEIDKILLNQPMASGVIHLFSPHTTAGLLINEGADPDVCFDLLQALDHLVPKNLSFKHREGNSPSHIMTMLTGSTLTLFIEKGKLQLGTWQKVFLGEFDGPRSRTVRWKTLPDPQQPFANIPIT